MTDASGGNAGARSTDGFDEDDDVPPPPARPALSDRRRPPIRKPEPPPWPIPTARVLWLVSFALTAIGLLVAFLAHEGIGVELEETLLRVAPQYDTTSISSLVDGIYWASVASLGVVVMVEAVLLAVMLNRRGGARWLQLPVLILHVGAVLLGVAFLAVGEFGVVIEALVLAGLLFAVAAWIFPLLPVAHRWFRGTREPQVPPSD